MKTKPGFGGHAWEDDCRCGQCYACNLGVCAICGGYEGGLTFTCAGRKLTTEELDRVYKTFISKRDSMNWECPTLEECGLV